MGKRLLFLAIAIAGSLAVIAPPVLAEQLSRSSSITLSGTVLPGRYIYLDSQGDIQKVIGNTSQNITPKVLSENHVVAFTDKILKQYQQLLAENDGRMQAGQAYLSDKYNPYILFAHWVQNNPYFSQKII